MFIRLLLILILIAAGELYVLFRVHELIGLASTLGLTLLTSAAGAYLARTQGLDVLARIRGELASGRPPGEGLLEGALILSGGLLLLMPGFCTDIVGFLLLAPFSRNWIKHLLGRHLQRLARQGVLVVRRF